MTKIDAVFLKSQSLPQRITLTTETEIKATSLKSSPVDITKIIGNYCHDTKKIVQR